MAQLGLPTLVKGQKPEAHITGYQMAIMNRLNKLQDARSRTEPVPGASQDQIDSAKKTLELFNALSKQSSYTRMRRST